jgi:predicted transporter
MVLRYPVAVAGHLLYQVHQFSGEKLMIWASDSDASEDEIQHGSAIKASCDVCVLAVIVSIAITSQEHSTWQDESLS